MMRGCLALVLAVLRLGWVLPQRFIETGVDNYSGQKQKYARDALDQTEMFFSEFPGPGLWVAAYRLTDVRLCPDKPPKCGPPTRRNGAWYENPGCEEAPYAAEFQTYTVFGLPAGSLVMNCEATLVYGAEG